jgi:arylsulfatase A-like enzyme
MKAILLTVLLIAPLVALHAADTPKPNILVILTDDVGWGDFQCYNPQSKIVAPNVDRLAREGMLFTNAHSPAALCSPTRYSMLTGNYPWRGREAAGTWGFNEPSSILPEQKTVANLLQEAGYRTAMFGKAGFGGEHVTKPDGTADFTRQMTDGPKRWGFDYSFIIPRGHQNTPHLFLENELPVYAVDELVKGRGKKGGAEANLAEPDWDASKVGARLLDAAEKFLDDVQSRNKAAGKSVPFFMHFCSDGAHAPYQPAGEIRGTPLTGQTQMTPHTDMVLETDMLLGKLMEMLEARGLMDDTLICFTSDNGGIPTEQHLGHDAVGGLRGLKGFISEGGHRVPFVVRWPGRVPAGTVRKQIIGAHDIVATAIDSAGVRVPPAQCLDAVSLLPVLTGQRDDTRPVRAALLVQSSPGRDMEEDGGIKGGPLTGKEKKVSYLEFHNKEPDGAKTLKRRIRKGNLPSDGMAHALYDGTWKLVLNIEDQPAALYDLQNDPTEVHNLIAEEVQAKRVKAMEQSYREIRRSKRSAP